MLILGFLGLAGCGHKKSTDELLSDLKATSERDRVTAVRLLPGQKRDAAKIVPALIEALKDKGGDIRWSAAIGLGTFGAEAREAIPALTTALNDQDARVREAAGVALSRIDPIQYPVPPKLPRKAK
jgi:HEAT repeat protein